MPPGTSALAGLNLRASTDKTDNPAMTKPFSIALKQKMVARLTGVNAVSAAQLARETGISQQNLSRWLSEARNSPIVDSGNGVICAWNLEQKARIIAGTAGLESNELARYLESEGVKFAVFKRWCLALDEAGEVSVGMIKRIGKLERELVRKNRALAAAAALLLLGEPIDNLNRSEEEIQEAEFNLPA
jgi:transposase